MIQQLQFKVEKARGDDQRDFPKRKGCPDAAVDISPTLPPAESFVIQTKDRDEIHWTLTHPRPMQQVFTCGKALF